MNNFLFFIFLILFCLTGIYSLLSKRIIALKNPFDSGSCIYVNNAQQFLLYSALTGLIMFNYEGFFLNTSAIRLFLWVGLFLLGILFFTKGHIIRSYAMIVYILYLSWIGFMGIMSPEREFAFRNFLKYLFPLLVFLFAMKAMVYELLFIKMLKMLVYVSLFYLSCYYIPIMGKFVISLTWGVAATADFFAVVAIVCIALFELTKEKKYLLFFLCFLLFSVTHVIRTGILGIVSCISIYYFIKYRLKSLPIISIILLLFLSMIFYIPSIRNKMFRDNTLTVEEIVENGEYLSTDKIDTNARQAMWDWSLMTFFKGNEVTGSGLGVLQAAFYSRHHPFGELKMVHNDYVQILCDTGLIGISLFLLWMVSIVWHCILIYRHPGSRKITQLGAILSGSTLVGIMVCSITDNALNYSLATYSYPCMFYGITLYLDRKSKVHV